MSLRLRVWCRQSGLLVTLLVFQLLAGILAHPLYAVGVFVTRFAMAHDNTTTQRQTIGTLFIGLLAVCAHSLLHGYSIASVFLVLDMLLAIIVLCFTWAPRPVFNDASAVAQQWAASHPEVFKAVLLDTSCRTRVIQDLVVRGHISYHEATVLLHPEPKDGTLSP